MYHLNLLYQLVMEIEVKVLDLNEGKKDASPLSLKATTPGPWDGVEQKLLQAM